MVSCGMESTRGTTVSGPASAPQKIGKYEVIREIGFKRRGSKIVRAVTAAIKVARARRRKASG